MGASGINFFKSRALSASLTRSEPSPCSRDRGRTALSSRCRTPSTEMRSLLLAQSMGGSTLPRRLRNISCTVTFRTSASGTGCAIESGRGSSPPLARSPGRLEFGTCVSDEEQDGYTRATWGLPRENVLVPLTYYKESLESIDQEHGEGPVLVFSDDLNWCRCNLGVPDAVYVEGNPDWLDLTLMSRCEHHVCANSTFSWWGAFLSQDPSPIVHVFPGKFPDFSPGSGRLETVRAYELTAASFGGLEAAAQRSPARADRAIRRQWSRRCGGHRPTIASLV